MRKYGWILMLVLTACRPGEDARTELPPHPGPPPKRPMQKPPEIEVPEIAPPEIDWTVLEPRPVRPEDPSHGFGSQKPGATRRLVFQSSGPNLKETAVAASLKWLIAQQAEDGGWSFDSPPSTKLQPHDRANATSLVLLSLAGAGQTQSEGMYKRNVERGLEFLLREIRRPDSPRSPAWERSFAHVLPAYALCEHYALTNDPALRFPAQRMVDLLQTDVAGDRGAEDSLAALRLIVLRTAHLTHLDLHRKETILPETAPRPGEPASTVAALHQLVVAGGDPATDEFVQGLLRRGSTGRDIADDFLACLTFTCGSDRQLTTPFGQAIGNRLINAQERTPGPNLGSWQFADDVGGRTGGRLYCTALATLTLEAYYRHLRSAARSRRAIRGENDDFPL